MRILITDGDNRASLAATRSLGKAGHELIIGERHQVSLASSSKYCSRAIEYPDPYRSRSGFLSAILDVVRGMDVDFLLPMSDVTMLSIAESAAAFSSLCLLPFGRTESLFAAADKRRTIELAERLNVPIPETHVLSGPADSLPERFARRYPLVIKPSRSRIPVGEGWSSTSVTYANDADQLRFQLSKLCQPAFPVLVQERIKGPGIGIFACAREGQIRAYFSHRRLREKPPSGGVSVLRESVLPNPLALEYAGRLLEELSWTGVAMVEFKLDERDAIPKLMEINGRFWGSLQLAIDAGVDYPVILLDMLCDRAREGPPDYRAGVRSRWLWGDLDALLLRIFKSGPSLQLTERTRRTRSIIEFFRPHPDQHLEVLRWDDPKPWMYETKERFLRMKG